MRPYCCAPFRCALLPSSFSVSLFALLTAVMLLARNQAVLADEGGQEPWSPADGDRIVWLGDGLIEQAQYSGWLETAVTAGYPDRDLTFRNLGWNADTPAGSSRLGLSLRQAGYEAADEGWQHLQAQLELCQPDVLVIGYGMASALESGIEGLGPFKQDYERLLAFAKQQNPAIQFVLLSPLPPRGESSLAAGTIDAYSDAIKSLAEQHAGRWIDLREIAWDADDYQDPVQLRPQGYRKLAVHLGEHLPGSSDSWQTSSETETLRQAILVKNEWWFHRSRPANMAYVFGFRKREQGQNAGEIPQYDALVQQEEQRIAKLRALQPTELPSREVQTESQFAVFTPQPTPEFTVADGWEVSLWAENPQLNKPIQINFDPQGRLWVASSEAYPMIEVGQAAPDKILVLEDTDGDGKADKSTTFAEGLLIPTGVAPGNGGVYVAQSTDLLFLKDTDGDGQADQKTRLESGFGTEDTHHNLHTLRWGPDGRLYMNQSVYTRTNTETPHGVTRLLAGGGLRYDTRRLQMEVFFRGLWNAWGHQFDRFGQSFMTDGAGFRGVAWVFPQAALRPTPKTDQVLDLISPGNHPKFASAEILGGPSFPDAWRGALVTCDFRANRVTGFRIEDDRAGFVTQPMPDLLRTSVSTFRPIDVAQGPDGALYIADWSNPIINHGEVDFRDPRRDRWHGRIWRLRWKGAEPTPTVDLSSLPTEPLLDRLASEDRYQRDQARRVLIERGVDGEVISQWAARQSRDLDRLQALWLQQAFEAVDINLLDRCLASDIPEVAAAAVRVLGDTSDTTTPQKQVIAPEEAFQRLANAAKDPHARVRLEAVCGLRRVGSLRAAKAALQTLETEPDRFLRFAVGQLVRSQADSLAAAIKSGELTESIAFVMNHLPPEKATESLTAYLAEHPLPDDGSGPWIELIGRAGDRSTLDLLWQAATARRLTPAATAAAMRSLHDAQRLRKLRPTTDLAPLRQFWQDPHPPTRRAAIELAGVWQEPVDAAALQSLASDPQQPDGIRRAAIATVSRWPGKESKQSLIDLADRHDPRIAPALLSALARSDLPVAAERLYAWLPETKDAGRAREYWRAVLQVPKADEVLASQLPAEGISKRVLQAGLDASRDAGKEARQLQARLEARTGASMEPTSIDSQQIAKWVRAAAERGDARRGEAVYLRNDLQCVQCHAIGGFGGNVGPDMTSLGASAPADYIVESLYDPSAKVKEGYHSMIVATDAGEVFTGIEQERTDEELILRDAKNNLVRIPLVEIVAERAGPSLMPTGVIDRLSEDEQVDLIRFLTELGKPGPFDASRGGVARQFEILPGTHRVEQQGVDVVLNGEPIGVQWTTRPTRVNGRLPRNVIEAAIKQPVNLSLVNVYLRYKFQRSSDGPADLVFEGPKRFRAWIDGEAIEDVRPDTAFGQTLSAGPHTVVLQFDARDLPEAVRLQVPPQ